MREFCKVPTQRFFKEAFGVDARLDPNHEDGSCLIVAETGRRGRSVRGAVLRDVCEGV